MHEVTLQSLQQLWCCYMLVARSKWCMKWGNLRGTSLEYLEKAVCGAGLFSFPSVCFILINFKCQNENCFHSEQGMALFELKKNLKSRRASVFPWFLAGAQTLLGALSTSDCPDGLSRLAPDTSKCGNKPVGWLPSWVSDVLWLYFNE